MIVRAFLSNIKLNMKLGSVFKIIKYWIAIILSNPVQQLISKLNYILNKE